MAYRCPARYFTNSIERCCLDRGKGGIGLPVDGIQRVDPPCRLEVIALIRKMSQANPRWGAPRIHGDFSSERPREIPLGPVRIAGPFSRVSDSLREVFLSFLKKSEPLTLL